MTKNYELDLNDKKNILEFLEKNSIIEASAGTGKTHTIIELVKTLVLEKSINPENILIVTFTEKATSELKERLFKKFCEISEDVNNNYREKSIQCLNNINNFEVHTIHSFCNKLIREYPFEIGCEFENSIIDDSPLIEEFFFDYLRKGIFDDFKEEDMQKILSSLGFDNENTKNEIENNVLEYIKKVKFIFLLKRDIPTKEEIDFNSSDSKNQIVNFIASKVYEKVKKFKRENGLITFDDMIHYVYNSVQTNKFFVQKLRERYKYAFIDEFQDTDPIQWEIFKTIFLNSNNNRICLIGDPKQSIYLFRNACVDIYFEARDFISKNGGYVTTLNTNYRSTGTLIEEYNKIFKKEDYFITENIKYDNRISTPSNNKKSITGLSPLNLIEFKSDNKNDFYKIICSEIKRIVHNENIKIFDSQLIDGRSLSFKDIAILVSSRIDANKIQKYLTKNGIPSSFYKKNLLFQSDEAIQIFYLLDYLSDIKNSGKLQKLLLSDFFTLTEDKDRENYKELLSKIYETSKLENIITNFFNTIELEKKIIIKYKDNYKRIITNYRHIAEKIESIAFKEKLSLYSMKNRLLSLIYSEKEEELSEDLFRNEGDEDDVVKIMTIHISKGLEFPVVFDVGAIKGIANNKKYYYYSEYNNEKIKHIIEFDNKNSKEKIKEEYRRLHYVAITRAKYVCYLPLLINNKESKDKVCLAEYLNLNNIFNDSQNIIKIEKYDNTKENIKNPENKKIEIPLIKKRDKKLLIDTLYEKDRFFTIKSFSSLKKNYYEEILIQDDLLFNYKDDENYSSLQEIEDNLKSLSSGKKSGTMLHRVLEKIDYFDLNEMDNIINDCMKIIKIEESDIYDNIKSEIKNMLNKLVNKELFDDFNLKKLTKDNRKNEVEFYFYLGEDFINGAIDLLFNYKDKYYIIDWKSNKLEGRESIENNFSKYYETQAKIYSYAIKTYLKKTILNFNYERDFGGVIYIYLRYINEVNSNGIIFKKYGESEIENFYKELVNEVITSKKEIIEKIKRCINDE